MTDIFARVSQLREQGVPFSLATIVSVEGSTPRDAGSRMIIFGDATTEGTIGGGGIEKQVIEDGVRLLKRTEVSGSPTIWERAERELPSIWPAGEGLKY